MDVESAASDLARSQSESDCRCE